MTGPFELVGDEAGMCVDGVCAMPDQTAGTSEDDSALG